MSDTSSPEQDAPDTEVDAPETETVEESTTEATADVDATAADEAPAEDSAADDSAESGDDVDPAEEFKAELRMQEGDWYVIHSYAGYENRVKHNLETRIAILRKKAIQERLSVPDEVLEYIASRVSSNIRELEGALIRVTAFANLNRQEVDMTLAEIDAMIRQG